jgi:hypothetical protein
VKSHFIHSGEMQHQVPEEGYEPEDEVGKVHPYCILHTSLTGLVGCWMCSDVHFAKDAEEDCPEYAVFHIYISICLLVLSAVGRGENLQHNSIPEKSQSVLEQEEEYTDGRQSAYDNRICPLRVRADVIPSRIPEIVAVESDDSDGEDELQDAEDEAYVSAKGRAVFE